MIPAALTPEQQIARLVDIAKRNPRAKLLPALHEVQRCARLAELRESTRRHKKRNRALDGIVDALKSLEQVWKGGSNGA